MELPWQKTLLFFKDLSIREGSMTWTDTATLEGGDQGFNPFHVPFGQRKSPSPPHSHFSIRENIMYNMDSSVFWPTRQTSLSPWLLLTFIKRGGDPGWVLSFSIYPMFDMWNGIVLTSPLLDRNMSLVIYPVAMHLAYAVTQGGLLPYSHMLIMCHAIKQQTHSFQEWVARGHREQAHSHFPLEPSPKKWWRMHQSIFWTSASFKIEHRCQTDLVSLNERSRVLLCWNKDF